jgi:hypothetical protein
VSVCAGADDGRAHTWKGLRRVPSRGVESTTPKP